MVSVRHVRHATLELQFAETRVLVDPMLGRPGSIPPIPNTPNQRENPLVPLPPLALDAVDAVLVTHTHRDHLDDEARERLTDLDGTPAPCADDQRPVPVLCQPADADDIGADFEDVRPVDGERAFAELTVTRVPARHGHGDLAAEMGPVSGFVLSDGEESVYVAGDTVWYDPVAATLETHDPDVVILNAGAAQFTESEASASTDPITMTAEEVATVARATDAGIVAVHMDAINHCLLSRADLLAHLETEGLDDRVTVPHDGASVR